MHLARRPPIKWLALGKKLRVTGTPNLIFGDGMQVPGYLPAEELEKTHGRGRQKIRGLHERSG